MQLQITSSESAMTAEIDTLIRSQVQALEDYVNDLTGCTRCLQHLRFMVIAKAGRVRIHLDVPGGELTIDKQNRIDLSLAIDEAFAAARFKLEEYVHKVRHDVRLQDPSPHVRVTTIFPTDGYGVLETLDGREVHFRRDGLADDGIGTRSMAS
jgi:ribosome-associated translation inhibitor RaiA